MWTDLAMWDDQPRRAFPIATVALIITNILIFIYTIRLPEEKLVSFVANYAFIPAKPKILSLFSYIFIHGGLFHLIFNMWYMWTFADNVEDRLGPKKFLGFYFSCGLIAILIHWLFKIGSEMPCGGASGAISGVIGAYLLMYPEANVATILFFRLYKLPAFAFIGLWFIWQLFLGATFLKEPYGVAYGAHIGGFIAGIVLIRFFRKDYKPERRFT